MPYKQGSETDHQIERDCLVSVLKRATKREFIIYM